MADDIILQTERLVLRKARDEDADDVVAPWTDPEITRYIGGPRDPEEMREGILEEAAAERPEPVAIWSAVDRGTGERVGDCGLVAKEIDGRDEIEVFYLIAPRCQGRGLATEAARALREHAATRLGRRRVVALVDPANAASIRVAEKAGFARERLVDRPNGRRMVLHAWSAD